MPWPQMLAAILESHHGLDQQQQLKRADVLPVPLPVALHDTFTQSAYLLTYNTAAAAVACCCCGALQDFSSVYASDPFDIIIDCLPGEYHCKLPPETAGAPYTIILH